MSVNQTQSRLWMSMKTTNRRRGQGASLSDNHTESGKMLTIETHSRTCESVSTGSHSGQILSQHHLHGSSRNKIIQYFPKPQHASHDDPSITCKIGSFWLAGSHHFGLWRSAVSFLAPWYSLCLFIYSSLRLVPRNMGDVIVDFICRPGQSCFSGCSKLSGADNITGTACELIYICCTCFPPDFNTLPVWQEC